MKATKIGSLNFSEPLIEGTIISRPNRFLMQVRLGDQLMLCHCPVTGNIGSLSFTDTPCLLSKHSLNKRKYEYTVEAISLNHQHGDKKWIGINQTKINEFLEYFIKNGYLKEIVGTTNKIKREVVSGNSKFDFLAGDHLIESKLFLNEISENEIYKVNLSEYSYKRFIQQYNDLIIAIKDGYNADIIFCYIYNAPLLTSPVYRYYSDDMKSIVQKALVNKIKHWQINMEISKTKLKLLSCSQIK